MPSRFLATPWKHMLSVVALASLLTLGPPRFGSAHAAEDAVLGRDLVSNLPTAVQNGRLVGPEWHWRRTQFSDDTSFAPILETADGAGVASFLATAAAFPSDMAQGAAGEENAKISFDLTAIDDAGLMGPSGGQVAVAYEFCIPATPGSLAEVQAIDPTVEVQPGAPGRIGCAPGEVLGIGSTHQPNWRAVLGNLAALDYVTRIDRFFAE